MSYETEEQMANRQRTPAENRRVVDERRTVTNGPGYVQEEQVVEQTYAVPRDAMYGSESVVEDESAGRYTALDTGQRVIWFIAGLFLIDLGLRFFFKLTGANAGSGFANFIYGTTEPLVAPFRGIFGAAASGAAVFEPVTLVAMLVYALVAWLLVLLLGILLGGPSRGVREYRRDYRSIR